MVVIAILPITQQDFQVWLVAVILCVVNCTVVIAFLRTNEKPLLECNIRIVFTLLRIFILTMLDDNASVSELLFVFLLTDSLYTAALFSIMYRRRHLFKFESGGYANKGALIWGSVNAALRNIPRLLVFSFVGMFYNSSELIALRLYLAPREYLVSLMGIVNTAFFKEIFKGNAFVLSIVLFSISLIFQVIIFSFMIISDINLDFAFEAIIFYISAAVIYAVSQQHWRLIEQNQESTQVVIHILSTCMMGVLLFLTITISINVLPVTYLSLFYFTWSALVLYVSYKK